MASLGEQDGGISAAAARTLLERKNATTWSYPEMAEELGWSLNTVDRYLHGQRVMPLDAFYRLARLLELDPRDVLAEAEIRSQAQSATR